MWKYVKQYLPFAILAALFMVGEVLMDLVQPGLMSTIVDDGVLGISTDSVGSMNIIWSVGRKMILFALFGGFSGAMNNVFSHLAAQNIGNEVRKDCFRRIMHFSFPQVDRFGTGSLITRVTNDITQLQNLVSAFIRGLVRTSMLTFGSIYFLFLLNRTFGLIALCSAPFIIACLAICLHLGNRLFSTLQDELDKLNTILQEDVAGIRIIKACVRELYEKKRFGKANDDLVHTQLHILIIFAFMNPVMNAIMYAVVVLVLLVGSYQAGSGATTPGVIMAAITYTTQMLSGILMLVMLFQNISRGTASWRRLKAILVSEPELKDGPEHGSDRCGEITFQNVSFAYPGSGKKVLDKINLTIHAGETVAIMGTTGCGKSTLVNLIPRFYDVTEGAVLVDGVDVREYQQFALREKVSIALQKSELFSIPIRENIRMGSPNASDADIETAAQIAQAEDFIRSCPDGYDTLVAERGTSLSGGQKQRISIARALLKPAEILIFDDTTSALDLKTEANLYAALRKARPHTTRLIIAQRIASARHADRILVLDQGTIAAYGTHEELLQSCGIYQDIYYSQIGKEGDDNGGR